MNLGENIRRARLLRGLTQAALAEKLDVSDRAVNRWETGAACPDIALLPRLALTLDVSTDALLGLDLLCMEQDIIATANASTRMLNAGDAAAAVVMLREKSAHYPGQPELMVYLARALLALKTEESTREALALCQVAESTGRPMRLSTTFGCKQTMAYALNRLGRKEEAARMVEDELPAIWVCRELVLPRVAPEERAGLLRRSNVDLLSGLLMDTLRHLARDTGAETFTAAADVIQQTVAGIR